MREVSGVCADHAGRFGGLSVDPDAGTVVWERPLSDNPKDIAARDKCPLQLIPPAAERLVAEVLANGAAKYGPWNWRAKGIDLMTYIGAIQRHASAIRDGQDIDPESGKPHTAHIAATAMILMDAAQHGKLIDDRPGA